MDIVHLKADEREVECAIRGISTDSVDAMEQLKKSLAEEADGTKEVPLEMHSSAKKRPNGEITQCKSKLKQCRQTFLDIEELSSEKQISEALILRSRVWHLKGRLDRASQSPGYGKQAQELLSDNLKLLVAINQYLADPSTLNQSIESVKELECNAERQAEEGKVINPALTELFRESDNLSEESGGKFQPDSVENTLKDNQPTMTSNPIKSGEVSTSMAQAELVKSLLAQVQLLSSQLKNVQGVKQPSKVTPSSLSSGDGVASTSKGPHVYFPDSLVSKTAQFSNNNLLELNSLKTVPVSKERSSPEQVNQAGNPPLIPGDRGLHNSTLNIDPIQNYHPTFPFNPDYNRRTLSRCGISYNGSPTGITVEMFLFQLDSVVKSNNVSSDSVLLDLHLLLKDVALQWYWTYRRHNPLASWVDLRKAFQERFKDRRTPYEIRRMVESRKQLVNETFLDYYHHMWNLALQCHTPYSDEEFIQLLINNMKPVLQYHLTDRHFSHINELIKSCTAWEDSLKRFRTPSDYNTYPRRVVNEITSDLMDENAVQLPVTNLHTSNASVGTSVSAYRVPTGVFVPSTTSVKPISNSNLNSSQRAAGGSNIPICFNCNDIGHVFQDCSIAPMGYFCYRCGLKDTITPKCTRCTGNRTSGPWRSGIQGSQTTSTPSIQKRDPGSNTPQ